MSHLAVAGPVACTEDRRVTALYDCMEPPLSIKAMFGTLHGLYGDCASDVDIFKPGSCRHWIVCVKFAGDRGRWLDHQQCPF